VARGAHTRAALHQGRDSPELLPGGPTRSRRTPRRRRWASLLLGTKCPSPLIVAPSNPWKDDR